MELYDIIKRLRHHFISYDDSEDGKDTSFIQIGTKKSIIRVSNHCSPLWIWHKDQDGDDDDMTRISLVFENTDTYKDDNLLLRKPRKTPLKVMEFVYRITEPTKFTEEDILLIIKEIEHTITTSQMYNDKTQKLTYSEERVSI